jgi:predicted metalloprotease with PDZ domain
MIRMDFLYSTLFRTTLATSVIIVHCVLCPLGTRAQMDSVNTSYYYDLTPTPASDRTELEVSLKFNCDTPLVIGLPTDYYGTPKIREYVTVFEGANGTTVVSGADDTERLVHPNDQGIVSIRYVISYDPLAMDRYAFAPNTGPSYFYVAGCQWLLPIGDLEREIIYHLAVDNPMDRWTFYCSEAYRADSMVITATYEDLASLSLGGCTDKEIHKERDINGKPVDIYIQGGFDFDLERVSGDIETIVRAQRDWFDDFDQAFYNVVILPRTGLLAGTAESNLFVCFVDRATVPEQLYKLIAHEMFHYWLPGKMEVQAESGEYDFKYDWFHEGFTDYLSRLILLDIGIMSRASFVNTLNFDLISIANNPSAKDSYQRLADLADADKFSSAQKKLAYYRGALIALNWDETLKARGSSLQRFMLALRDTADSRDGQLSFHDLVAIGKEFDLPVEQDISKYITRGEPISVPSNLFGNFILSPTEINLFDPGFDMRASSRQKTITGVIEGSEAYKAGLRNGMTYVRRRNSNRFSNSWSESEPLQVTVLIDGEERVIAYFPTGPLETMMLYEDSTVTDK